MKNITQQEFSKINITETSLTFMLTSIYNNAVDEDLNLFLSCFLAQKFVLVKLIKFKNLQIRANPSALDEIKIENNKIELLDFSDRNHLVCDFEDIEFYEVSKEDMSDMLLKQSKEILRYS